MNQLCIVLDQFLHLQGLRACQLYCKSFISIAGVNWQLMWSQLPKERHYLVSGILLPTFMTNSFFVQLVLFVLGTASCKQIFQSLIWPFQAFNHIRIYSSQPQLSLSASLYLLLAVIETKTIGNIGNLEDL